MDFSERIKTAQALVEEAENLNEGLPPRTLDTMSDVIALTSPSGKISKRALKQHQERIRVALFGKKGLAMPTARQPTELEYLLRTAKEFRELAARGMGKRKYTNAAKKLEKQAVQLIQSTSEAD